MWKSIFVLSLFINVIIVSGSATTTNTEKKISNWFLHLGIRDAKDASFVKSCNDTSKNFCELPFLNTVLIPTAYQQECIRSQNIQKSPIPLVELGGRFYYFGTYFKANFFKAMQFCKNHGMELLSIESNDENTRILNHLISYVNKIDHFWTSGTDLGEEGHFFWLSTGNPFNYTYWSPPQPDNAGKIENCLEIWKIGDKHYVWNDIPCTNSYNFICELKDCTEFCME